MINENRGWRNYNNFTGEVESGLYERPFIVRITKQWEEEKTAASFRTFAEAKAFIDRSHKDFAMGGESLHVENWNLEGYPIVVS